MEMTRQTTINGHVIETNGVYYKIDGHIGSTRVSGENHCMLVADDRYFVDFLNEDASTVISFLLEA